MDVIRVACDGHPVISVHSQKYAVVVWMQDFRKKKKNQELTFVSCADSLKQGLYVHFCLKGAVAYFHVLCVHPFIACLTILYAFS